MYHLTSNSEHVIQFQKVATADFSSFCNGGMSPLDNMVIILMCIRLGRFHNQF